MKTLGIYVHVPFCVQKCAYCDFVSFPVGRGCEGGWIESYFQALWEEIESDRSYDLPVDSVFFGGGTPSVVNPKYIDKTLCKLKEKYKFSDDCEISMEINPGTVDIMSLRAYRKMGINRISVGAQSLCDERLLVLGRIHNTEEFLEAYRNVREAGFENVSVDLMSALPGQTPREFEDSLKAVLALSPEHLSVYSLILEEGTRLYDHREEYAFPDEETIEEIDQITWNLTEQAGYQRYEISNFSKEGYGCRHNLRYWQRKYYRGYGLAASSMVPDKDAVLRFSSEQTMEDYLRDHSKDFSRRSAAAENRILSKEEEMEEFFFLGLRMTDGVDPGDFCERFHEPWDLRFGKMIKKYTDLGLMRPAEDGRLKFTREGMQVSTTILADFLL